jgi:hypothetical protein
VDRERVERGEKDGLNADERTELAELRAENAQLRMERDLLISQNGAGVKGVFQGFRLTRRDGWARVIASPGR